VHRKFATQFPKHAEAFNRLASWPLTELLQAISREVCPTDPDCVPQKPHGIAPVRHFLDCMTLDGPIKKGLRSFFAAQKIIDNIFLPTERSFREKKEADHGGGSTPQDSMALHEGAARPRRWALWARCQRWRVRCR
jgi:hypothetical protein